MRVRPIREWRIQILQKRRTIIAHDSASAGVPDGVILSRAVSEVDAGDCFLQIGNPKVRESELAKFNANR